MIAAILAMLPSRDYLWAALVVALIGAGTYEHFHLINEGKAHELAALEASSAKVTKQTAALTADLKARATMAEQAYDHEKFDNANYRNDHPVSVRMCDASANSGSVVSQAGGKVAGAETAGTAAPGIQPVPSGDSGSRTGQAGVDIGPMLSALAASADQVSSQLREAQNRE